MTIELSGKKRLIYWSAFLVLFAGYPLFTHCIERSDTWLLFSAYASLWILSLPGLLIHGPSSMGASIPWTWDFIVGLGLRLSLMFTLPNLSQDIYRFLWDGHLVAQGISPYLFIPEQLITTEQWLESVPENASWLIDKMGPLSAGNHSNYPPITQWIFALGHWLQIKSITGQIAVLRLTIILADLLLFFVGRLLLNKLSLNPKYINWYFLNPFVILELTGNLHFEAFIALCLVVCLWLLIRGAYLWAGIALGVGVGIKLIPLMFVPLIAAYLLSQNQWMSQNWSKASSGKDIQTLGKFISGLLICIALFSAPFFETVGVFNYVETTRLWFTKFEFNASFYYFFRWLGFLWKGYNLIALFGPLLSGISVLIILYLSKLVWLNRCSLIAAMMWTMLLYLLLATTVHPWYWITVLILSIMTKSRIGLIGSVVVFLSYSAYQALGVDEKPIWILIEYGLIIGFALFEWSDFRQQRLLQPYQNS